jgi:hypothetical protein
MNLLDCEAHVAPRTVAENRHGFVRTARLFLLGVDVHALASRTFEEAR